MCVCILYIYVCVCMCIYIYIHIYVISCEHLVNFVLLFRLGVSSLSMLLIIYIYIWTRNQYVHVLQNNSKTKNTFVWHTKQKYRINHHLNCNDKCLICLLSCKVCGLQYVVSTTDEFRLRWNNYRENDRKALRGEEHMQLQLELLEHFAVDNHNCFLTDSSITLIDKTDGLDPMRRVLEKGFDTLSWWLLLHAFYKFFLGRSLVYVKCILLK